MNKILLLVFTISSFVTMTTPSILEVSLAEEYPLPQRVERVKYEKEDELIDCLWKAESTRGLNLLNPEDGGSPSYGHFQLKEIFIKDYYRLKKEPMVKDWYDLAMDYERSRELVVDSIYNLNKFKEFGYRTQAMCKEYLVIPKK